MLLSDDSGSGITTLALSHPRFGMLFIIKLLWIVYICKIYTHIIYCVDYKARGRITRTSYELTFIGATHIRTMYVHSRRRVYALEIYFSRLRLRRENLFSRRATVERKYSRANVPIFDRGASSYPRIDAFIVAKRNRKHFAGDLRNKNYEETRSRAAGGGCAKKS